MIRSLVVATRSAHKLREIREILADLPVELLDLEQAGVPASPREDVIEVFDSFEENALAKARYFAPLAGAPVLADDSGICVDALAGAPGVRSKRFSGREELGGAALDRANTELLLERIRSIPAAGRGAHYACAVALATPRGEEIVSTGRCDGVILEAPRGEGGFGYDPVFLLPDLGRTMAELSSTEKNRRSHRAEALRAAGAALRSGWPRR